jgi:hypothetical protein
MDKLAMMITNRDEEIPPKEPIHHPQSTGKEGEQ